MGNILNFNFNKLDLKLSNSDYWDFFLGPDGGDADCSGMAAGTCLVVWYDFNNPSIYESNTDSIYSLVHWDNAVNTGYTLNTIGLTGIDNGLITFEKGGDPTNPELLAALTGSTLVIPSNDMRLNLNRVTGTTGNFIYPIDLLMDAGFEYSNLCGGFYQGFYKLDGNSYEVLPTRVNQSWAAEFWLKPQNLCSNAEPILNDVNPNNKGFFFYMGARAENKFWNIWEGADTGCTALCSATTACTDTVSPWCTIPKESEISIVGDYGMAVPLDPPQVEIDLITNGFLIYGRAHDGSPAKLTQEEGTIIYTSAATQPNSGETCHRCLVCGGNHDGLGTKTVCSYDGKGIAVVKTASVLTNHTNPFLIYGRATKKDAPCNCRGCAGPGDNLGNETVCSFSGRTSPQTEVNYKLDVFDNALGFRITDDGRIGYRLLSFTGHCEMNSFGEEVYVSGITVEEGYSEAGMVNPDVWSYVVIKFATDYKDDCDLEIAKPRKGRLMFYINGKLKYIVDEFDEFVARRLNEFKDKQVGVPFNISLGGGSQGLIETQTFDGRDPSDAGLYIEENFAGSFIGGISQFKFNICNLTYCDIQNNFMVDAVRYGLIDDDLLLLEDGFLMLLEDGEGMR